MPRIARSLLVLACVLLVGSTTAPGQSRSASDTLTVSATVVRPCSVATPTAAVPGQSDAALHIRCGRAAASSSSLGPRAILPVSGTPAAADVQTTTGEKGLVVSVNF